MYPAKPRNTPIYAVVDLTKKRNRTKSSNLIEKQPSDSSNLPDLVALTSKQLTPESVNNKGVLEDIKEDNTAKGDVSEITEESNTSERGSVFLSDVYGDISVDSSEENSSNMVKSHSANNSPIFDDYAVQEVQVYFISIS